MSWPNESPAYRSARDELLRAEIELRRQEEAVAARRRALPLGGEVTGDYAFDAPSGPVTFAELFAGGKDTLAKAPIDQFTAWGKERGWRFTPLYSSAHTTFNRDYQAESDEWGQLPIAHVFTRSDGTIHHRWSSELFTAQNEPGQHPRHVDYMWPLWKVLDVTPAGRGSDWQPRYAYGP